MEQENTNLNVKRFDVTEAEIKECSDLNQLMNWKLEVDDQLTSVKLKIDSAKRKAAARGEFMDVDRYHRTEDARRILGRLSQKIAFRMSEVRRKTHDNKNAEFLELFISTAKAYLPGNIYQQILDAAKQKMSTP